MILNVSVKPYIKIVYSSETNPKVWVQKSQAEAEHPWAQTHSVNPSPGGPQEDKGSLLLWMGGRVTITECESIICKSTHSGK